MLRGEDPDPPELRTGVLRFDETEISLSADPELLLSDGEAAVGQDQKVDTTQEAPEQPVIEHAVVQHVVTEISPEWIRISSSAACEDNAEGIKRTFGGAGFTLESCKMRCAGNCRAIDFYSDSKWCNLFDSPCQSPNRVGSGASSYRKAAAEQAMPKQDRKSEQGSATAEGHVVKFRSADARDAGIDACMYATGARGAMVKFKSCSDDSSYMTWRKRSDGNYESSAYPGLCPARGGARC